LADKNKTLEELLGGLSAEQLEEAKKILDEKSKAERRSIRDAEEKSAREAIAGLISAHFPEAQVIVNALKAANFASLTVTYSEVDGIATQSYQPKRTGGGGSGDRGPQVDLIAIFEANATDEDRDAMEKLERTMPHGEGASKEEKAAFNRATYAVKKKVHKRVEATA
jgi:phosphoglycolate phosphatase-like HAD superfamily hydrolase